jgi:hypothetical protein
MPGLGRARLVGHDVAGRSVGPYLEVLDSDHRNVGHLDEPVHLVADEQVPHLF